MKHTKHLLAVAVSLAITSPTAFATNGMNMEGYGPIATGMGGASMAYDNGTAAMMNNPATLGMMEDGDRLDLAIGVLAPDVKTNAGTASWNSSGDSYLMPAAGWARKNGKLTIGAGAFAQGGMGTEYSSGGPGGAFGASLIPGSSQAANNPVPGYGQTMAQILPGIEERSEVGVMRILVPVSYQVDDKLSIGGSIDYVRATMDFKWFMPGNMIGGLIADGSLSGTMIDGFVAAQGTIGGGGVIASDGVYGGYFDSSDNNDYDGNMSGDGFSAKLGFTYNVDSKLTIGGTYHPKTAISDLKGNATLAFALTGDQGYFTTPTNTPDGTPIDLIVPLSGKIKIIDFQWPETVALGVSYQATDKWHLAADIKRIMWSGVMSNFKMNFVANNTASNGPFAGAELNGNLAMDWKDQTVVELGASYQANDQLAVRFGANIGSEVVPGDTLHYLFPATVENHITAGLGYAFSKADSVDFALSHAPEVKVTNPSGFNVTHAQTNYQLMYSHKF